MNRRHFLSLMAFASVASAAVPTASDEAAAISAIKAYLELVRAKDFGTLYDRHFHSVVKAKVTKEEFIKRMESGFSATVEQLCAAILDAREKNNGLDFSTAGHVPGTIAVTLRGAKKPPQDEVIKPGNAIRIQVAPDPKELKFYDID